MISTPLTMKRVRVRATGPKDKTGCQTCKKRRVKCDERKPDCIRCAVAGRKCEGYLNTRSSKTNFPDRGSISLALEQIRPFINQSPDELRSTELFFLHVAPALWGYFQESFWKFVLQVSFDEPSIRDAFVAVSAVYEEEYMTTAALKPSTRTATLKQLTVRHYNKSIRSMVKKMEKSDSIIVPVIGCLLFVCLEFLRQDIPHAIRHIDGGIKMIEQARLRKKSQACLKTADSLYEMEQVERVISPIFGSLNFTAIAFGRPGIYFYSKYGEPESSPVLARPMKTIEDAFTSFLDLSNAGGRFLHEMGRRKYTPGLLEPVDYLRQKNLLNMFDTWKTKLIGLEKERNEYWVSNTAKKKTTLKILHLAMYLCLSTCCSVQETSWDCHKSEFEELLDLVDQVMYHDTLCSSNAQSKFFSFELGILPALELVARKCRYSKLRRQALSMLQRSPKKECLFDSRFIAILDERIMELEEADLELLPGQIADDDQLPSEESRIHLAFFAYQEVQELRGWPVSFLSKPRKSSEEWHIREEVLSIKRADQLSHEPTMFVELHDGTAPYDLENSIEKVVDIPMVRPMDWPILKILDPTAEAAINMVSADQKLYTDMKLGRTGFR